MSGLKLNVGDLITEGLALCELADESSQEPDHDPGLVLRGCQVEDPLGPVADLGVPAQVDPDRDSMRRSAPACATSRTSQPRADDLAYACRMEDPAAIPSALPPVSAERVRAHARELRELARSHGLSRIRVASTGRLVVAADDSADYFDLADFQQAASHLLQADVQALPEGVLRNEHASEDLIAAIPL